MLTTLHNFSQSLKNRLAAFFRKREVLKSIRVLHAQDLISSPVRLHPMIRAQHAAEVAGIKAGRLIELDRRTQANPALPFQFNRVNQPVPKLMPISLRSFSRTPVPARAINLIKAGLQSLPWNVEVIPEHGNPEDPDVRARIEIVKNCLEKPNDDDSFREWVEMMLTDFLIYGMGASETQANPDDARPVMMWAVDSSTLQIVQQWNTNVRDTMPRYAQVQPNTPTTVEQTTILLLDEELMTIRDNIATDIPFGTGALEIAHRVTNDLLAAQRMAGIAGADQLGRTIFWWSGAVSPQAVGDMRDYLQSELEGMARVGMVGGGPKPDQLTIDPVSVEDLLLPWHEMLIRMIGNAFGLSAMALNVTGDVNRAVGMVLSDADFRTGVVPVAKRFEEAITRKIIHKKMGYADLRFRFLNTDDPDLETKVAILQDLYNCDCITSNEFNAAMGRPKSKSPFADLTMFEKLMIQSQVTQIIKQQQVPQGDDDPTGGQSGQNGTYDPMSEDGKPKDGSDQDSAGVGLKKSPKPVLKPLSPGKGLSLAPPRLKRLMVSTDLLLSASPELIRAWQAVGMLPQSGIDVADQMEQEQPGILEQLAQEVWDYLDGLAQKEIDNSKSRKSKLNKKWTNLAVKRYRKSKSKVKVVVDKGLGSLAGAASPSVQARKSPRRKPLRY